MKTVLTIAGSDCSGGAGIQADIKTMIMNGVYAMSAITALTAQNTTGVYGIQEASSEFLDNQLDCIFTDIFPDAVKIGMLSSSEIMRHVASKLRQYQARHIVLDPVMVSTSGHRLMNKDAEETLQKELFHLQRSSHQMFRKQKISPEYRSLMLHLWKKQRICSMKSFMFPCF